MIGASGFIGREIYDYSKNEGYDTIGTQYSGSFKDLIRFDLTSQKIYKVIPNEFLKNDDIFAVICSAIPKIDKCKKDINKSYELNVLKTIKLIDDLTMLGIKFIFLSSEAIYDGEKGYYDESNLPNPINEYGRQKVEVENYINSNTSNNLIFRLSMIVGDQVKQGHLFYDWYKCINKHIPIECIKGQIFSPTYVKDIAKAVIYAFEKNLIGTYNVSNSEYFLRAELAKQFSIIMQKNINIISKDLQEFDFLDKRALKTYLNGFKFKTDTKIEFTSVKEIINKFHDNILKY